MSEYKWKNMNSAPKDKNILVFEIIPEYQSPISKFHQDKIEWIVEVFWGKTEYGKETWLNYSSFNQEFGTYDTVNYPICWCNLPNFPTTEELDLIIGNS